VTVESTAARGEPRRGGTAGKAAQPPAKSEAGDGAKSAGAANSAAAGGSSQKAKPAKSSAKSDKAAAKSEKTKAGKAAKETKAKESKAAKEPKAKESKSGKAAGKAVKPSASRSTSATSRTAKSRTAKAGSGNAGGTGGAPVPSPEAVQLLTPDGERVSHPDYALDLSAGELRGLYRDMVLTRRFDTEATALQRQGELGLWASLLGQEAAQIGSGRALHDDDYVFPTYREHGVAWCRGVDPTNLLGMFRGVNNGGWDPNSNNFHLYTIVIGSQVLHATGYAMGVAKDGAESAVIAYFGDGASSQGDVAEAFTFASVYNAPVVFFCQNNQWAISEPAERQSRVPIYQRAQGFGFPGVRVDGNDVLACLAVTRAALERARSGEGPMLVEAYTYRMGAHTTSDDPTRYRPDEEREEWEAKDPIARLRTYLERDGLADAEFFAELDRESEEMGRHVREAIRTMPDPDSMAVFGHVYADGHALVDEERAEYADYLASFADSPEEVR